MKSKASVVDISRTPKSTEPASGSASSVSQRQFTPAEKALIRKVHGYIPAEQLLAILNERMAADIGDKAKPYTMDQLYAEIGHAGAPAAAGSHDWASLRKLLASARRSGLLASINAQVIDDFAVVFSLNAKQVLRLKDIVLGNEESES